jgi:ABC-type Fe3+ transport system permease subunit
MAGLVAAVAAVVLFLALVSTVSAEALLWHDEFDVLNLGVWNHLVTAFRGGNSEFEYYRNNRKNWY